MRRSLLLNRVVLFIQNKRIALNFCLITLLKLIELAIAKVNTLKHFFRAKINHLYKTSW